VIDRDVPFAGGLAHGGNNWREVFPSPRHLTVDQRDDIDGMACDVAAVQGL